MTFNRAAKTAPVCHYLREDRRTQAPVSALLSGRARQPPRPASATGLREQACGQQREFREQACGPPAPRENSGLEDEWNKCLGTMRALLSRMDAENRLTQQTGLPRGFDKEIFPSGPKRPVRASHTAVRPRSDSFTCQQEPRPLSRGSSVGGAPAAPVVEAPGPSSREQLGETRQQERPASARARAASASGRCASPEPAAAVPRRPQSARGREQGRPVVRRPPANGRSLSRRHTIGSTPAVARGGPRDSDPIERSGGQEPGVKFAPSSRAPSPRAPSPRRIGTPVASAATPADAPAAKNSLSCAMQAFVAQEFQSNRAASKTSCEQSQQGTIRFDGQ